MAQLCKGIMLAITVSFAKIQPVLHPPQKNGHIGRVSKQLSRTHI